MSASPTRTFFSLRWTSPRRQPGRYLYIDNTPMFVQIAKGLGIRSILHTDFKSTCAKLASFGLQNEGVYPMKLAHPRILTINGGSSSIKFAGKSDHIHRQPHAANFTVPLSCTGPMTGLYTSTNNHALAIGVYPSEITTAVMQRCGRSKTTDLTGSQHLPTIILGLVSTHLCAGLLRQATLLSLHRKSLSCQTSSS